jgi:hypothetical protein
MTMHQILPKWEWSFQKSWNSTNFDGPCTTFHEMVVRLAFDFCIQHTFQSFVSFVLIQGCKKCAPNEIH